MAVPCLYHLAELFRIEWRSAGCLCGFLCLYFYSGDNFAPSVSTLVASSASVEATTCETVCIRGRSALAVSTQPALVLPLGLRSVKSARPDPGIDRVPLTR